MIRNLSPTFFTPLWYRVSDITHWHTVHILTLAGIIFPSKNANGMVMSGSFRNWNIKYAINKIFVGPCILQKNNIVLGWFNNYLKCTLCIHYNSTYNIGFSMVLVMSVVPPVTGYTLNDREKFLPVQADMWVFYLHPPDRNIVEKTVQICAHEYRPVTKVMLQPTSLCL